jgi:hypothetical protein
VCVCDVGRDAIESLLNRLARCFEEVRDSHLEFLSTNGNNDSSHGPIDRLSQTARNLENKIGSTDRRREKTNRSGIHGWIILNSLRTIRHSCHRRDNTTYVFVSDNGVVELAVPDSHARCHSSKKSVFNA